MAIFRKKLNNEKMPEKQCTGLYAQLQKCKRSYIKYMTNLGAHVFHYGKFALSKAGTVLKIAGVYTSNIIQVFACKISGMVKKLVWRIFEAPVTAFITLGKALSEKKKKAGFLPAVGLFFSHSAKTAFGKKGWLFKSLNYALPVLAIVFLVNTVSNAAQARYAVSVEYNGQVVGYVQDEAVAEEAQKVILSKINYVEGDEKISVEPKLSVKKVSNNIPLDDVDALADKMIQNSDVSFVQANGLYINDIFMGAVKDGDKIQATLDSILAKYKSTNPTETVEFVDKIEVKDGLYLSDGIIDEDELVAKLTSDKQVEAYYTVVEGDAPTLIAEKVNLPYKTLKALNPQIETKCMVGQKVLINRSKPYVSVRVTRTENYDISIPYKTISVNDSSLYKGTQSTLINGQNGSANVTAKVSMVDGYEESRVITAKNVTKQPVDKKVAVGTKSTGAPQSVIAASGGGFMWPVGGWGGSISSYFYDRSYYYQFGQWHKGIDIQSNSQYLPIYASKGGRVVSAGWDGGLGRCVRVDHGNGWVTTYGHLSSIRVTTGQYVDKGDLLGIMGSTGNSTGVHLHFEIRQWDSPYNPLDFLQR